MSNLVRGEDGRLGIEIGRVVSPHGSHRFCPTCGTEVSTERHGPFRDIESFREFQLSGLCQSCQDAVFGESA